MQELGLADPGLAGDEERPTVRPCPSPEGTEPVHPRVAPNEVTGWRAAAGPFLRLGDAGVEHETLWSRTPRIRDGVCTVGTRPASKAGRATSLVGAPLRARAANGVSRLALNPVAVI
jgi:hypothetical protein